MTVSSFNTVTLHPKPIITFNVRQPSETLAALQSSGRFLVHLLAPNRRTARLAHDFSRGNARLALGGFGFGFGFEEYDYSGESGGKDDTSGRMVLPRLVRRDHIERSHIERKKNNERTEEDTYDADFTFVLDCAYLPDKSVGVYDHMIVLGTVERILSANANTTTDARHATEDFCLMYADTRFWGMGEEI
jgi:Flavin reductase like domain